MVTYQFDIDDDTWDAWKDTVPRSKSLDTRIVELIEADTEGRVAENADTRDEADSEDDIAASGSPEDVAEPVEANARTDVEAKEEIYSGLQDESPLRDALADVEFPSTKDREACVAAVRAAYEYLQENQTATMREFVGEVMPEHPLGYDVPDLEPGERYRGAWWRKVVKPSLNALDDVESPPTGGSDWTYTGENDE